MVIAEGLWPVHHLSQQHARKDLFPFCFLSSVWNAFILKWFTWTGNNSLHQLKTDIFFYRNQDSLLNVSASAFDVLPADSFVCWWKWPTTCSRTMTIHRFHECLAWMLRGFRMVAQTLSLTEKCHPDHLRSQLTKAHPAVHVLLCFSFFFMYHVWILCPDVLTIKLMVVNLCSYGCDL